LKVESRESLIDNKSIEGEENPNSADEMEVVKRIITKSEDYPSPTKDS